MKPSITVVSLGPGKPELMTLQTADALRQGKRVILRTERTACAEWLTGQGIVWESLDGFYDRYEDFDEMHRAMAEHLWQQAEGGPVVYAVPEASGDGSVTALAKARPEAAELTVLPGISRADVCLTAVPEQETEQLRVLAAMDCPDSSHDPAIPLLITEIDDMLLAGQVKLWLADVYDEESRVLIFPENKKPAWIQLQDVDRMRHYGEGVCLFVPPAELTGRERYCFQDLVRVMARLRGEDGCPWDKAQTHESLEKYLIEEAWEVVGAIQEGDPDHIADELGDVLLQVVFHASVGEQHGSFTLGDITTAICRKMIHRHPFIFQPEHEGGPDAESWEQLKREERGLKDKKSVLEDVSTGLPGLMRSAKVQKKSGKMDMSPAEALEQLQSAAAELAKAMERPEPPYEEMGRLLMCCANLGRLSGVECEMALRDAVEVFIREQGN